MKTSLLSLDVRCIFARKRTVPISKPNFLGGALLFQMLSLSVSVRHCQIMSLIESIVGNNMNR